MSVQRYSESWQPYEYEGMAPDHEGDWVRYEDHEAEAARLKAEAELGRQFAAYYRRHVAETTALPCQVEDEAKGSCVYNWRRGFERDMERCLGGALAALAEGGK